MCFLNYYSSTRSSTSSSTSSSSTSTTDEHRIHVQNITLLHSLFTISHLGTDPLTHCMTNLRKYSVLLSVGGICRPVSVTSVSLV